MYFTVETDAFEVDVIKERHSRVQPCREGDFETGASVTCETKEEGFLVVFDAIQLEEAIVVEIEARGGIKVPDIDLMKGVIEDSVMTYDVILVGLFVAMVMSRTKGISSIVPPRRGIGKVADVRKPCLLISTVSLPAK